MINVGIVGATGYAGEELVELLLGHPYVRITSLSALIDKPQPISALFPRFSRKINLLCKKPDVKEIARNCDLVFLALPHTASMDFVPKLLGAGKRVIDLSADYRFKNLRQYTKHYRVIHKDPARLKLAVYGLPELYRQKIKGALLVANPGCYPTCAILALAPLVAFDSIDTTRIVIDAKSGVTGAGRKIAQDFMFSELSDNFKAYKIGVHQHAPEIDQELSKVAGKSLGVLFVPHLLPLKRGIFETIYITMKPRSKWTTTKLLQVYSRFFKHEPFVRIKAENEFPALKDVTDTNFCDIGIRVKGSTVIIIAAIDNLLKGASGQAVQNMNIMYNFAESTSLL
ncbi:MAG: N-acetyl-gamma-glutamyl-phosphate reductase [Candidatus Omnitrophota bacterium]|jgi:N-acetyl-gamma-glutamyl-phosphate reductase|nr:MAG: N-acetyl-gamma-glutamyl-phosphate reductase [Candidatus Omnitrophota bacterium]